jgi:hypothetical protein
MIPRKKLIEKYELFRCDKLNAWLSPAACREQQAHQLFEKDLRYGGHGPCLRCPRVGDIEIPARTGRQPVIFGRGFKKIQRGEKDMIRLKIVKPIEGHQYRRGDIVEFADIDTPEAAYFLERRCAERLMEKQSVDLDMSQGYIAWPLEKTEADLALKGQLPRSASVKTKIGDLMKKLKARGIGIFYSKDQRELRFFPLNGTLDAGLAAIIHRHLYDLLQEKFERIIFVADGIKRQWPSESKTGIVILPASHSAKLDKTDVPVDLLKQLKQCGLTVSKQEGFLMIQPPVMPKVLLKEIQRCREALY